MLGGKIVGEDVRVVGGSLARERRGDGSRGGGTEWNGKSG